MVVVGGGGGTMSSTPVFHFLDPPLQEVGLVTSKLQINKIACHGSQTLMLAITGRSKKIKIFCIIVSFSHRGGVAVGLIDEMLVFHVSLFS